MQQRFAPPPVPGAGPGPAEAPPAAPELFAAYRLRGRTVEVWRARSDPPGGAAYAAREAHLAPDERARAARIRSAPERGRYVAGRALTRHVLARRTGGDPRRLAFGATPEGRPFLRHPAVAGLDFNLAHAGALAVLAVAEGGCRVGVDVEPIDARRDLDALALRFFPPEEHAAWSALAAAERAACWYRIWTRREAYTKALGSGLRDIGADHPGRGRAWTDVAFRPAPGYAGCLVLLPGPAPGPAAPPAVVPAHDVRGEDRP